MATKQLIKQGLLRTNGGLVLAGVFFGLVGVILVSSSQASSYHDTFDEIYEAINRGDPEVRIANGRYLIPHGKGLTVSTDGQRIIGESDRGVILEATGIRGEMGTKAVIDIKADNVEIANLVLTQNVDQKTHRATTNGNTYPVSGIWSEGNNWHIHDVHIDHTSYGLQLWRATPGSTRKIERVLVTNWGYFGEKFGHSGYAIYMQTASDDLRSNIEIEDFVAQNGSDIGIHDYATFTMPANRNLNGIAVIDAGNPSITGGAGSTAPLYLAKAEDLDITNAHFAQYSRLDRSAQSPIGYGNGIRPKRFNAENIYSLNSPNIRAAAFRRNTQYPIWEVNNEYLFYKESDRSEFSGLKELGSSWGIVYGDGQIPNGWEKLPGSLEYDTVERTNPDMPGSVIVRRTSGSTPPPEDRDRTRPQVRVTQPSANATVSGDVVITADATDDSGVERVEFYVNQNLVGTDTSAPYSYSWDTTQFADGRNTIIVVAEDTAGNSSSTSQIGVTVENNANVPDPDPDPAPEPDPDPEPEPDVDPAPRPASLSTFLYKPLNDGQHVKAAWNTNNSSISRAWIALFPPEQTDPSGFLENSRVMVRGEGVRNIFSQVEEEGIYEVRLYDLENNLLATSDSFTLRFPGAAPQPEVVDEEAPVVEIVSHETNQSVDGQQTVRISASDNDSLARVELFIDNRLVRDFTRGPFTYNWDTTTTDNGRHTLRARAIDEAGNDSYTQTLILNVENVLPDTEAPTQPQALRDVESSHNRVRLNWSQSTDNIGVVDYLILRNGVIIGSSASTSFTDTDVVPELTYSYAVIARDEAGNISEASDILHVTTSADPDLSNTPPATPRDLRITERSRGYAVLSWVPSSSTDLRGYTIYRSTEDGQLERRGFVDCTTGGCVNARISWGETGLSGGTTYRYTVRALNGVDIESEDLSGSITIPGTEVGEFRGAPSIFEAEDMRFAQGEATVDDSAGQMSAVQLDSQGELSYDFRADVKGGGHFSWMRVKAGPGFDESQRATYRVGNYRYRQSFAGYDISSTEWKWIPVSRSDGASRPNIRFYSGYKRDISLTWTDLPSGLLIDQIFMVRSPSDQPPE